MDGPFSIRSPNKSTLDQLINCLLVTALVALWCVAVTLLLRRIVGAFQNPLATTALIATGFALSSIGLLLRFPLRQSADLSAAIVLAIRFAPTVAILFFAIALSSAEASPFGLAIMWGTIIAEEIASTVFLVPTKRSSASASGPMSMAPTLQRRSGEQLPDHIDQQIDYSSNPNGGMVVSGQVRLRFAPRQRFASAHIAFCPPFELEPEFAAELISGPPATVKNGIVLINGARIDVRQQQAHGEGTESIIRFTARR